MSVDALRVRLAGAAEWLAERPFGHEPWRCSGCERIGQRIEDVALAHDLSVAERHAAPASPLARALACWATREAAREGVAWS